MHTLLALLLAVAASVVIARPPGPVSTTASQDEQLHSPTRKYLKDYLLPRFIWPHYFSFEETPREAMQTHRQPMAATEWLNQEIDRLSRMQMAYTPELPRRLFRSPHYKRWPSPYTMRGNIQPYYANQPWPALNLVSEDMLQRDRELADQNKYIDEHDNEIAEQNKEIVEQNKEIVEQNIPDSPVEHQPVNEESKKKQFALTPRDEGYFETSDKVKSTVNHTSPVDAVGGRAIPEVGRAALPPELAPEPPRHTRQNPNLSRTKTLIAENLDNLRTGLGHEDMGTKDNSRHVSVMDSASESPGSFYGVALLSAIGAAAVLAVLGFAFGWYTLSKRAKAAADVDYPAYGVTGPTIDTSGDRKLAHSAHMYHYQHQKQQIIAMERSGMEQRSGSVSDAESEDENEEGDYTVYECPGFATTGDMEVRNPMFNEDPTPATPGKCEVVKPQPKD